MCFGLFLNSGPVGKSGVGGILCAFWLCTWFVTLMWNLLSPGEEVKVEVVEDPCKCEARLAFQKQTQAAIQRLTAKNILSVDSDGSQFIINSLCSTFHCGGSWLFLPADIVIEMQFNSVSSCVCLSEWYEHYFSFSFYHLIVLVNVFANEFPWLSSLADVSGRIEHLENMVGRV